MKLILPDQDYYTFKQLSDRWNVSEDILENYLITDKIKKCEIVPNAALVPLKERKRISRLMTVLNAYAYDKVYEEMKNEYVSKSERANMIEVIEQDFVFKYWVGYKEYELDKIILVIPQDEVNRFESEYSHVNKSQDACISEEMDESTFTQQDQQIQRSNFETEQPRKKKCNLPDRANGDKIRPRDKAPLTKIIEHIFDEKEKGADVDIMSWESIYGFLKRELTRKAVLSDGNPIDKFVAKIVTKGSGRGIEMTYKIPRRLHGQPEKLFPEKYFREQFSKLGKKRNT